MKKILLILILAILSLNALTVRAQVAQCTGLKQTAKNIAFGVDAYMGRWRGIFGVRPISPLESTDSPVINTQSSPSFLWSQKCTYALGSPCP